MLRFLPILISPLFLPGPSQGATAPQQWHKVTLDFVGPETSETAEPNPFLDYRLDVTFTQGDTTLVVPGYFAADGDAAHTSAEAGNCWRVHFSPPSTGDWQWTASFRAGEEIAIADNPLAGTAGGFCDGQQGTLHVVASDKQAPDFRALGRLAYAGHRYPITLGTGEIFLKQGSDAPENLLAYADFDGDFKSDGHKDNLIKSWQPHEQDWQEGDPTWKEGKGKGLIGAINYLAGKGLNAVSFLTFNVEGDDRNVFPYLSYDERFRFDISRLAQWEIVFEHATSKGLFLHFKTQETENETLLDDGDTGPMRKLYYRELIARFAHHPGLNWNMGEENGEWGKHHKAKWQTTAQRLAMGRHLAALDPYEHPIVIHNGQWPHDLYGPDSPYHGASLQTGQPDFRNVPKSTLNILTASRAKGKQWMVACDEPGDAQRSLVPDETDPEHDDARQNGLWGQLLAGGWGCEWYFGYQFPHSDLTCQDYRSRDLFWDQCRLALQFFREQDLPLLEMENHNELLSGGEGYCLAQPGKHYLILSKKAASELRVDLKQAPGEFTVQWFNPRRGGPLQTGSLEVVNGGQTVELGEAPAEPQRDWVILLTAR
ncbi:DUF5060 domain-containing protein [Roseibacillus ishigakijimensis]|uniref:DUF5060 domain-containing protein n=1 Tax=Roseibacillus ishigakijimensis TaxID=454146 RepID=A0A934RJZ5_9BACT|nr:DUF5060 domain-containing protein [Roseibacillus ishigakijimensis]MBK1832829.1 DUF5060 domain-containing protein [Roseibacillus ishigakijimensis]